MDTLSLTYKELAEKMGIKVDSARKTVLRKRWQRITGNDGIVRILVPIDALPQTSDSPLDGPADSQEDSPALTIRELQAKVKGLEQLLILERKRADAVETDRDRWHELAVMPWWKRLVG